MSASAHRDTVSIDPTMIARFSRVVFGYVEGPVAVRILAEKGRDSEKPWTEIISVGEDIAKKLTAAASRAAAADRALFVVPATLIEETSATQANLAQTSVLIVDLDDGAIDLKRRKLIETLGPATLTVASGGVTESGEPKLHLYWRLTEAAEGEDLTRVANLRLALAEMAGGDLSFGRMTQPIRVAGTLHCKSDKPRLAKILEHTASEIDLDDAEELVKNALAVSRFASGERPSSCRWDSPKVTSAMNIEDLRTRTIRDRGQDGITRFDALSKVIGHWIRRARMGKVLLVDAWRETQKHNATWIVPPWDDQRLRREFDALLKRDKAEYPEAWRILETGQIALAAGSDDALADAFVRRHGDGLRSMPVSKSWYRWTGSVWRKDDQRVVTDLVRQECREAAAACDKPAEARKIASAKTIQAVERLASSDPRVTIAPGMFDAHPMLLNTPGAVINLETGVIDEPRRGLLMTHLAGSKPAQPSDQWRTFIGEITNGDPELGSYLQRVAGYCLTGSTEEQAFFFLHGSGANGKSVFVDTIAAVLGDYARTAPFETFAASRYASHPTDIAGLQGARMVVVSETERDRDWAESRIKAITGGDLISARFMRGDFFEYRPMFKLVVIGNHRPGLSSFGEAMRRRLHLIPFDVTIPAERRDPQLAAKLKGELGGVLSWMLEGCKQCRLRGLDPPQKVLAATSEYFETEDLLGQWLAERCIEQHDASETFRRLYDSWKAFAQQQGEVPGSQKAFTNELKARGFTRVRTRRERGWRGLALMRGGSNL